LNDGTRVYIPRDQDIFVKPVPKDYVDNFVKPKPED